jgi:hypothetical protein
VIEQSHARGEELKKKRHLFVGELQPKMQVLHPLAEFEDKAVENGHLVFHLLVISGIGGGGARVPRLPRRRRLVGPYVSWKSRAWRMDWFIHRWSEGGDAEKSWVAEE